MDMVQVNPGHVIVSIRSHCETIVDLDEAQAASIFQIVNRVAKTMEQEFKPEEDITSILSAFNDHLCYQYDVFISYSTRQYKFSQQLDRYE